MLVADTDYGISVSGGIGPLANRTELPHVGADKSGQDYSELIVTSGPGYTGADGVRTETAIVYVTVSDTASVSATEDPIDSQDIASSDIGYLAVTEVAVLGAVIYATDTASLTLGEAVNLGITNNTAKSGTDTASLTLTEVASAHVSIEASDTASLSVSESTSADITRQDIQPTDTASLSVDDSATVSVITGDIPLTAVDSARLTVTETATVSAFSPPNQVRRVYTAFSAARLTIQVL